MRGRVPAWIWWPNAVVIVTMLVAIWLLAQNQQGTRTILSWLPKIANQEHPMPKSIKRAAWVDVDCIDREVVTQKGPHETQQHFCNRHDRDVAHDMQVYGVKAMHLTEIVFLTRHLAAHPDERIESPHWAPPK